MGSVPATSVQYASNDKEQDTNATLSNVKLKVDGEDVDPNSTGVNTDITKAQVITEDEKVDMIDVNLQTDLANKEERDKIRDAKDKVGDVVETVKNVVDKNNVTVKENLANNRFATRGANAVEDDEKLSKLLNELKDKNLPIDDAKDIILATVQKMYLENGFTDMPNVKFEDGVSGGTDGARGTETGTIYLDINKIKAIVTKEGVGALVGLIAHETAHSIKAGEKTGNLLIEEDFADSKGTLADNRFTEAEGTLSGDERKEALAKIKKEVKGERAISDSLTVSSKDEPVEGNIIQLLAPSAFQLEQMFLDATTKYGTIVANKIQELYYTYGPVVLEAAATGGQKFVEYLNSNGGDSATGENFDPNDPRWKELEKVDVNKLNHIFGKKEHKLDSFLSKYNGNQEKAFIELNKATQKYIQNNNILGNFKDIIVNVNGTNITVRGAVVNGIVKIGTAFIP